ncbi:MAG TPA: hypothetical protein DD412_04400 [Holosporales bacterium]|nr:hypothetical protein [Holosporales bacterium]
MTKLVDRMEEISERYRQSIPRLLKQEEEHGKGFYNFDPDQLKAIQSGEAQIPRFTWEHNPRAGRMLLVDSDIHKGAPHVGSIGLFQ